MLKPCKKVWEPIISNSSLWVTEATLKLTKCSEIVKPITKLSFPLSYQDRDYFFQTHKVNISLTTKCQQVHHHRHIISLSPTEVQISATLRMTYTKLPSYGYHRPKSFFSFNNQKPKNYIQSYPTKYQLTTFQNQRELQNREKKQEFQHKDQENLFFFFFSLFLTVKITHLK